MNQRRASDFTHERRSLKRQISEAWEGLQNVFGCWGIVGLILLGHVLAFKYAEKPGCSKGKPPVKEACIRTVARR